jgi:hypothetical protein
MKKKEIEFVDIHDEKYSMAYFNAYAFHFSASFGFEVANTASRLFAVMIMKRLG